MYDEIRQLLDTRSGCNECQTTNVKLQLCKGVKNNNKLVTLESERSWFGTDRYNPTGSSKRFVWRRPRQFVRRSRHKLVDYHNTGNTEGQPVILKLGLSSILKILLSIFINLVVCFSRSWKQSA